ncbi:hypothetical protein SPHINGO8AM_90078 [Sphingomonas sp. 8AM]|nr:hypothetical protein SPHINGO8AM_90078 [Sphingomonas sp. 8AM]
MGDRVSGLARHDADMGPCLRRGDGFETGVRFSTVAPDLIRGPASSWQPGSKKRDPGSSPG